MTITQLCKKAHENAVKHGFWEDFDVITEDTPIRDDIDDDKIILINNAIGSRLMLIVTEASEALEELRHRNVINFKEELADIAIRLGDLCGGLKIDIETEIKKKMEKNKSRPYKHGKEF
jgi:NTP pyrophosphatase (non-canonical NTP hydrolase)